VFDRVLTTAWRGRLDVFG